MSNTHDEPRLHSENRLFSRFQEYLGEFVYGGIDGSVTTFAVVAGSAGADLSSSVVLILGFANLFADGFSMSIGAYLSKRSEKQNYEKHRAIEYWEVDNLPEAERQEVREIFQARGFEGDLLEKAVDVVCSDRDTWVDVMMKDELDMIKEKRSAFAIGLTTFGSFIVVGFIPLIIYVWDYLFGYAGNSFLTSCLLTSAAFIIIGFLKSYVTETSRIKGVMETLILGVLAALVAYFVGDVLANMLSG